MNTKRIKEYLHEQLRIVNNELALSAQLIRRGVPKEAEGDFMRQYTKARYHLLFDRKSLIRLISKLN